MKILMIVRATLFSVPGGDTTQVRNTAAFLRKTGIDVDVKFSNEQINYAPYDLIHYFNVFRPAGITGHIKASGKPYVVSTIFVDYSELEKHHRGVLFSTLQRVIGNDGVEYLKTLARHLNGSEQLYDSNYVFRGHRASVQDVIRHANCLLPNSENEYQRLVQNYGVHQKYEVIPNAVDPELFDPEKRISVEKRQGVLCVARIERIKNQLNLIRAMNGMDCRLTLIGRPAPNQMEYYQKCLSEASENVRFIDQVDQSDLVAYYAAAKVHVLPSWFETTGLSSLEAGIMGCNLVVTDKGDVREYLGEDAVYCDPANPDSIRNAIKKALELPLNSDIVTKIRAQYVWERTASKTKRVYEEVIGR